jgi:hypothetical protein
VGTTAEGANAMSSWLLFKFGNYRFKRPQVMSETLPSRIQETKIPRRDGSVIVAPIVLDSRTLTVEDMLVGYDTTDLQTQISKLNTVLESGFQPLYFRNNRYLNCRKTNVTYDYERGTNGRVARATIELLAIDPYTYGDSHIVNQSITTNPQTVVITNQGNAIAKPVIQVTANQAITTLKITNLLTGDFFTFGPLVNTDILIVDYANFNVTINGVQMFKFFAGNFITLMNGANSIKVEGTTNATLNVTFKDTYYEI